MKIACPFYGRCLNSDKECHRCQYNANIRLENFLLLQDGNESVVRFLNLEHGYQS